MAAVHNIYIVPPHPLEEHHEVIENFNTIIQGMQTNTYDLEGLAQVNAVLNSSNSTVMAKLAQMTLTTNAMQAQLNILESTTNNTTMIKRKFTVVSVGET